MHGAHLHAPRHCDNPPAATEAAMAAKTKVGVLGASGYTGSELVRILLGHPRVEVSLLTADSKAGRPLGAVFPQFAPFCLPDLVAVPTEWSSVDADLIFCALPHGTTQKIVADLLAARPEMKVVDLSADFRLFDPQAYARWYGHAHQAPALQEEAVYGLTELYRRKVRAARLVANPGCYTTASELAVLPLLKAKAIEPDEIIVDAKSGVSGAGRAAKEANLFTEVSEGLHAYGVGHHRHMAELDEQFSLAAGRSVTPSFTPHLVPMNRGILATIYVRTRRSNTAQDLHAILAGTYAKEPFVHVLAFGQSPQTRHVRGSNHTLLGVVADRRPGRVIILSALDNLVKGASGQAVQNMNLMLGFPETLGLGQVGLFP
jgi:N-acetyl-gamma-glutamyl-phosphate reductase